jgi:hypothetical protein
MPINLDVARSVAVVRSRWDERTSQPPHQWRCGIAMQLYEAPPLTAAFRPDMEGWTPVGSNRWRSKYVKGGHAILSSEMVAGQCDEMANTYETYVHSRLPP